VCICEKFVDPLPLILTWGCQWLVDWVYYYASKEKKKWDSNWTLSFEYKFMLLDSLFLAQMKNFIALKKTRGQA
jgi:hypothetical protein